MEHDREIIARFANTHIAIHGQKDLEILRWALAGLDDEAIGREAGLGGRTVRAHRERLRHAVCMALGLRVADFILGVWLGFHISCCLAGKGTR